MRYEIDVHGFRVHQKEFREMNSPDKVVVITGCSSGFGAGAVKAFADKGYRVWGTVRDVQGRHAATKQVLEAYSSKVSVIDMDVADDASVTAAFAVIQAQGPVDVLINNAGVMYLGITRPSASPRRRSRWRPTTLAPSAPCRRCCRPCARPNRA
jgi:NAD(P)-dependent dehydrogenase (short-subunit alcohol dehydrogenase family)